jgi:hypothetical protein
MSVVARKSRKRFTVQINPRVVDKKRETRDSKEHAICQQFKLGFFSKNESSYPNAATDRPSIKFNAKPNC